MGLLGSVNTIHLMFKKPFSFQGRIRRTEYGLSYIIYIINIITAIITGNSLSEPAEIITLILFLPLIYFMIAQSAKRCHDRGYSGWCQIIPFFNFYLLFAESKYGPNQYGPNPKGEGYDDELEDIGKTDIT